MLKALHHSALMNEDNVVRDERSGKQTYEWDYPTG